jgi:hypothetical protein
MKKTTAVVAFKCDDGLYRRGEIFIHTSTKNEKKILGMVTDGFEDYIQLPHITTGFFDYIAIMFGVEDYIFVFNENLYIYIYEITDSKNYECFERMEKDGPEMKKFIENHKEYFDE